MPSILELPEDILLELTKDLDIADLISLLSTCRVIRKVQFQKSLWLDSLARIREVERQPHALSNAQALSTLSLQQLQHTAQQVNRFMKNWRSHNPRPTRIRQLSVEPSHGFFCLTGTPFIVSHNEGGMSCWDIFDGKRVAHLEIPGLFVRTKVPCMEEVGRALICAATGIGRSVERLVAICIDYRDGARVSISHVVSPVVNEQFRGTFFISRQAAGFSGHGYIITWTMNPNANVVKQTHQISRYLYLSYFPLDQSIYIFSRKCDIGADASVHCLPLFPRPSDLGAPPNSMTTTVIPTRYSFASNQREIDNMIGSHEAHVCPPRYGVFAVTRRSFEWEGSPISVIHFWQGGMAEGDTALSPGNSYYHEQRDHIKLWAVGHSGTYVLLLVDAASSNDGAAYLGLVHFSSTPTPHTTFRKLDIGDAVTRLGSVSRMALDDALGTIFLLDEEGNMSVISFA
ncbi:hypothetical protein B0H16DRAFT_1780754 [Mycena metata]|uniref:F-box domain-containing protein n=1 Tax=Mycena metata TaxID=1033252 RepID=A0AAD7HRN6_9AGAR|nr:hypothetical protein B0H16DRAFT_1780754 [Mycena metata]